MRCQYHFFPRNVIQYGCQPRGASGGPPSIAGANVSNVAVLAGLAGPARNESSERRRFDVYWTRRTESPRHCQAAPMCCKINHNSTRETDYITSIVTSFRLSFPAGFRKLLTTSLSWRSRSSRTSVLMMEAGDKKKRRKKTQKANPVQFADSSASGSKESLKSGGPFKQR